MHINTLMERCEGRRTEAAAAAVVARDSKDSADYMHVIILYIVVHLVPDFSRKGIGHYLECMRDLG